MDPDDRVEVETPREPRRGDGGLFLGFLDLTVNQAWNVVAARLASDWKPCPDLAYAAVSRCGFVGFGLGLSSQSEGDLGADQLEVERGDLQQNGVGGRRGIEASAASRSVGRPAARRSRR